MAAFCGVVLNFSIWRRIILFFTLCSIFEFKKASYNQLYLHSLDMDKLGSALNHSLSIEICPLVSIFHTIHRLNHSSPGWTERYPEILSHRDCNFKFLSFITEKNLFRYIYHRRIRGRWRLGRLLSFKEGRMGMPAETRTSTARLFQK